MVTKLKTEVKKLYDTDYNLWVLDIVDKLKNREFNGLDLDNLIEEVEDLGKRDKRKIESLLIRLFEHLLKLRYWKEENNRNRGHWEGEIANFRRQIDRLLQDSPSLKPYLRNLFNECYQDSRFIASKQSQLPLETFPEKPIADFKQVLDKNWLP